MDLHYGLWGWVTDYRLWDKYAAAARRAFSGTGIVISTDRQRHLGAAPGHKDYTATYVTLKVQAWCDEVKHLAEIADIFPHAACAGFTHGLFGRCSYLIRSIPDIKYFLQPLEDVIHQSYIPALFGRPLCSPTERDLYALLVCLGGLGLINPCSAAHSYFFDSEWLTHWINWSLEDCRHKGHTYFSLSLDITSSWETEMPTHSPWYHSWQQSQQIINLSLPAGWRQTHHNWLGSSSSSAMVPAKYRRNFLHKLGQQEVAH